jgi:hypothetical protein
LDVFDAGTVLLEEERDSSPEIGETLEILGKTWRVVSLREESDRETDVRVREVSP